MLPNLKISKEERILIKILFSERELKKYDFQNINYKILVKLASSHLVLPCLYTNLKKKKYLRFIPKDLNIYLKEIHSINLNRNKKLIEQYKRIEILLKKNKIDYFFFKGAKYLVNGIYNDIGERMVGDIDILVKKNKIQILKDLLIKESFQSISPFFKYRKTRHEPRFVNKEEIALEIHNEVLRYRKRYKLSSDYIFKNKKKMDLDNKISILSFEVNDYGRLFASYNYRNIYDIFKLSNEKIKDFKQPWMRRFLIICNLLGICNIKIRMSHQEKIYLLRVVYKNNFKLFKVIDNLFCKLIKLTPIRFNQLIEFIVNKEYRKFIYKKKLKMYNR